MYRKINMILHFLLHPLLQQHCDILFLQNGYYGHSVQLIER